MEKARYRALAAYEAAAGCEPAPQRANRSRCYTSEMRLCVAALLCACAVLRASGSEGPRWLKIKSSNFELFTTAGERSGRDVARHFEQVRAFFLEAMGIGSKSGPPVRIVVFRADQEFAPYAPNEFASAYYLGAQDRDYIVMKSASSERFPVAVHEYIHLLVKHAGIAAPVWFNEGLAELYSNLKPLAGKVAVGDIILPHLALLQQSKWIDLSTLLAVQPDSALYNEKTRAGLFYAESWALVHMLYLDEEYRSKLPVLLTGIKAGAGMPETFQKAYGKPLEQVQRDLQSYMRGTRFNASLFNTKLAKEVDAPEVRDSSPLETGLVLADILANMRAKAAEARQMYNQLARDNPKEWQAEQGLARLSLREGNRAEALTHYARAAELRSTSAKMYYEYGRLLRAESQHAEAVAVLKRATELDPDDRDARLELGYAYVIDDQHAAALAQLQSVKHVTEEQAFGYFHAMAYAYYRLDRTEEAEAAAATCRKYARTPEQVERLDQLVDALNYVPRYPLIGGDRPNRGPAAGPGDDSAPLPPRLRRGDGLAVAEGTLQQVDCMDGRIRMRIGVGADSMSFALLDLASITAKAPAPIEFACGPQSPRRIRIEYEAKEGAMPETVGVVRSVEFLE
jgi:tetratricopeptide (TPR) repeat protein